MHKLTIVRTNPEQGREVRATVYEGSERLGSLQTSFETWIQFEKLLKEGLEHRRLQEPKPRIWIDFKPLEEPKVDEPPEAKTLVHIPSATVTKIAKSLMEEPK